MKTKCGNCNSAINLTDEQESDIREMASLGGNFYTLICPTCHKHTTVYPLNIMGIDTPNQEIKDCRIFYCPTIGCTGFVSYYEDSNGTDDVYECSSCGVVWENKQELLDNISDIIKKYPHRKSVYIKTKDGWNSIPIGSDPVSYYSKVQNIEKED